MPSASNANASATPEPTPIVPSSLTASAWNSAAGQDTRRPHERTTDYARKLLAEIQVAQERLESLLAEQDPTVTVTATTAVPMDDLLRVKAISKAQQMFRAPVFLIERVDPSILGGIILETSGQRYDASVRAQLSAVHRGLVAQGREGGA